MRWAFLLLVLLNGAFYVWQASEKSFDRLQVLESREVARGNITLLAELADAGSPSSPVVVSKSDEAAQESARDLKQLSASDSPPSAAVDGLVVAAEAEADVAEEECWFLGPYAKREDRFAVPPGLNLRWVEEEYRRGSDFWVYLGPFATSKAAGQVFEELRRKKIDSFVIRQGALKNAVSLGVFSDPERAQKHIRSMDKRGYSAEVREIVKYAERYWLVRQTDINEEGYRDGQEFLAARQGAGRTLDKKNCNLIASYRDLD